MTPLCFIDTETTGVHPDRRVWEVAIIRRDDQDGEVTLVAQIDDVDLSAADPFGLKVGGFYERHVNYGDGENRARLIAADVILESEERVAHEVEAHTRGAHLVGAVPNFDADVLDKMLRRHRLIPSWHYHLVDVEAMTVGYLNASSHDPRVPLSPPWRSDDLSLMLGVNPPAEDERHTALGDARWAMRWYDAMVGASS